MSQFNVIVVGAGEINFGSPEGPWNHTARLEALLGDSLHVLSLVDPDVKRSEARLAEKRATGSPPAVAKAWAATRSHRDLQQAADDLGQDVTVDLIVLGCPPHFRGTLDAGKDTDVQMQRLFPHAGGYLIEKPIAAVNPFRSECSKVADKFASWKTRTGGVVSIGYMLRYNKAVLKLRELLAETGLVPTCINARYFMAYEFAAKLAWWNKAASCGPVVEQATHFVDLIRFLAGPGNDVCMDTVRATTVEHDEEAGKLVKQSFDESLIPPAERVPRVTSAFWKHKRGTIGTLNHGITLHAGSYDTEIEVLADGWILRVNNAYDATTTLTVRKPGQSQEQVFHISDDPFLSEFETIVAAIQARKLAKSNPSMSNIAAPAPLSDFADALKTYELTWRIRLAAEESRTALQ
ncbi:hypothetical protein BCV70DRAFT_199278 [Testicularia cyperi]|uniref:Oxidoreductase putative C-terminal domain-containing protein n=1 Tax=Testicularia cyperi TaxID=1882483 RepID=A0A317XU63_9BASI|nr:hypothetical protein BCV70DRAFT_199278 [Testicularia cyperi]